MAQHCQYLFSVKETKKQRGCVNLIHINGGIFAVAESKCCPTVSRLDSTVVWKIMQVISMVSIQLESYLSRINNQLKASQKCM